MALPLNLTKSCGNLFQLKSVDFFCNIFRTELHGPFNILLRSHYYCQVEFKLHLHFIHIQSQSLQFISPDDAYH
jgi:hypothetical protein